MRTRAFWLLCAAVILAGTVASAADFETGRKAYRAGDFAVALQEWTPLAEAGNRDAAFGIGLIHDRGHGVARDPATAALWYRQAAEAGHAGAAYNLGNLYRLGDGVPQDAALSVAWWARAAAAGLPQAQVNLGVAYQKGDGVAQDDAAAYGWYRRAADAGEPLGQFYLGVAYEAGIGVAADLVLALDWYRKAAAQGEAKAQARLAELAIEVPLAQPAEAEPTVIEQEPTVAAVAPAVTVGYYAQAIAMGTRDGAEGALAKLRNRFGALLDGVTDRIQEAQSASAGTVFRVQFGPIVERDAARALCRALRDQDQDCLVIGP